MALSCPQSLRPLAVGPNKGDGAGTALRLYSTPPTKSILTEAQKSAERKYAEEMLVVDPGAVTKESTVRPDYSSSTATQAADDDVDFLAGVKSDWRAISDTFSLRDVPRETYYIGLAGVLPYLATSLSTYYLAWDIEWAHAHGHGLLLSGQTAEALLHLIQPLQVGYGAVIISFLGAIHWGLEFAGYGGHHRYRRYAVGVVAPAIAWPTILMPVEYALITQFLTFNFLYFTDARATRAGWFPSWYGTYRFVLTFVVGASIMVSLIGRGKISDKVQSTAGPAEHLEALRAIQRENLEKEEAELRSRLVAEAEAEDDE